MQRNQSELISKKGRALSIREDILAFIPGEAEEEGRPCHRLRKEDKIITNFLWPKVG